MSARIRARATFSNVVACIALFTALGGTSYAAAKLPKNSVSAVQVKDNSLTGREVKNSTLTLGDLKDDVVTPADLRNSGAPIAGVQLVEGPENTAASGVATSDAICPAGTSVIGGGSDVGTFDSPSLARPYQALNQFSLISVNQYDGSSPQFQTASAKAIALCAPVATGGSLKHAKGADARVKLRAAIDQARREHAAR